MYSDPLFSTDSVTLPHNSQKTTSFTTKKKNDYQIFRIKSSQSRSARQLYNWCMLSSLLLIRSRLSILKTEMMLKCFPNCGFQVYPARALLSLMSRMTAMSSTLDWLLSVSCLKLTSGCLYTGLLLWVGTLSSRSAGEQLLHF